MKKRIICAIVFIVLLIVGYGAYYFMTDKYMCNSGIPCSLCSAINIVGIETDCILEYPEGYDEYANRHSCLSYSLNHPYVRCPYEEEGETRYCREVRCPNTANCRTIQRCKD